MQKAGKYGAWITQFYQFSSGQLVISWAILAENLMSADHMGWEMFASVARKTKDNWHLWEKQAVAARK